MSQKCNYEKVSNARACYFVSKDILYGTKPSCYSNKSLYEPYNEHYFDR